MDALASIEPSWLEDPNILPSEVRHGHHQSTWTIGELFDGHLVCIRVANLPTLLIDERKILLL